MLLYRTKYYGVADSVRKAKSEYLNKLISEAKRKMNDEEWEKCLSNERNDIKKHYGNEVKKLLEKGDALRNVKEEELPNISLPTSKTITDIYNKYKNKANNLGVDVIIDPTSLNSRSSGRYDPRTKTITLTKESPTIIHELEHAVQDVNEKGFRFPNFGTGIARKNYMKLYNGRENVHKYIKSIASEDGAVIAKTKKLYLEPDVPIDFVFSQHNTPYMQLMRAPLGDTNLMRNYADIYYKNWIDPELYSKIKENAKKKGIDLEKEVKVNRTPGTPEELRRLKKWWFEKFGHSNSELR